MALTMIIEACPLACSQNQNKNRNLPFINAVKLDRALDGGSRQAFAYYVVTSKDPREQRQARRCRTRLRSGKVLDPCNALLTDCQIYDWSETGARIRLARDVSVPLTVRLYVDWPETLIEAKAVWRKGREMGLCFDLLAPPRRISRAQLAHLRGYFYSAKS